MTPAANSMAALITAIGDIFTAAIGWISDVATAVTAQPTLLLWFLLPLVGLGVGMFKRLVKLH